MKTPPQKRLSRVRHSRKVFYARLASIPKLGALPATEKADLVTQLRRLHFPEFPHLDRWAFRPVIGPEEPTPAPIRNTWGRDGAIPGAWAVLVNSHPRVQELINDLLDGDSVELKHTAKFEHRLLTLDPHKRMVVRSLDNEYAQPLLAHAVLLLDLLRLFEDEPFPFKRCPLCRTVFVPVRRQKYCSPVCLARGSEADRDPDERRAYARAYMRARRQREKARKTAQKKAVAGQNAGLRRGKTRN